MFFFPKKIKTAKYAGNWDPKSKQPLSYRFQKWLLVTTRLTKNMQVLVYGNWEHQTKNVKPFFTATYKGSEIEIPDKRDYSTELQFVYTGSLVSGKRPLYVMQIVEALHRQDVQVHLDIYGDGILKEDLQQYITENSLDQIIVLKGNQPMAILKEAFKNAHFALLPSKSEGWPKAIAEAMFFGAIPIATKVSCIPDMLNNGQRGILIEGDLDKDVANIKNNLKNQEALEIMSKKASKWSQNYTLDVFEAEIYKLLKNT